MPRKGSVNLLHDAIDVPLAFIRDRVREFLERGGVDLRDAKEQRPAQLVLTVQGATGTPHRIVKPPKIWLWIESSR